MFTIENASKLGDLFHTKLKAIKNKYPDFIKFIFGKGLVAAIIFMDNNNNALAQMCDIVCEKAFQRGLLVVHTGRESIKLAPLTSTNLLAYEK